MCLVIIDAEGKVHVHLLVVYRFVCSDWKEFVLVCITAGYRGYQERVAGRFLTKYCSFLAWYSGHQVGKSPPPPIASYLMEYLVPCRLFAVQDGV